MSGEFLITETKFLHQYSKGSLCYIDMSFLFQVKNYLGYESCISPTFQQKVVRRLKGEMVYSFPHFLVARTCSNSCFVIEVE